MLYSSRETSELSQWLGHDGSTINIVVGIIINIIIIINECRVRHQYINNELMLKKPSVLVNLDLLNTLVRNIHRYHIISCHIISYYIKIL